MEEFKGTKGEAKVYFFSNPKIRYRYLIAVNGTNVCKIGRDDNDNSEQEEHNAELIRQAFGVVTRTGLTPEQMEKEMQLLKSDCEINSESFRNQLKESNTELAKMEARLKEAC